MFVCFQIDLKEQLMQWDQSLQQTVTINTTQYKYSKCTLFNPIQDYYKIHVKDQLIFLKLYYKM